VVNENPLQILRVVPHNSVHAIGGLATNRRHCGEHVVQHRRAGKPEPLHFRRRMIFALVAQHATGTNVALASRSWPGAESMILTPREALERLQPGDVALGRLDVKPTLDGVDDGVAELAQLAARGVRVLNGPRTLLAAHDKLLTARALVQAGVPHPATTLFTAGDETPPLEPPVVIKPRFGSWGADVFRCDDGESLKRCLDLLPEKHWFRTQGAIVQDLIPPRGWDLRLIVAGGRVIGAVSRVAAPGEWRTNVALGAVRAPVFEPPAEACDLAIAAAEAVDGHLVGVDLLPTPAGGYVVLELNGACDFVDTYSSEDDVFASAILALAETAGGVPALLPHAIEESVADEFLEAAETPPAS
jgi:RimK family alpha-L-glutamate ligase